MKTTSSDARGSKTLFLKLPKTSISCLIATEQPPGSARGTLLTPLDHLATLKLIGQHLATIQSHYLGQNSHFRTL